MPAKPEDLNGLELLVEVRAVDGVVHGTRLASGEPPLPEVVPPLTAGPYCSNYSLLQDLERRVLVGDHQQIAERTFHHHLIGRRESLDSLPGEDRLQFLQGTSG